MSSAPPEQQPLTLDASNSFFTLGGTTADIAVDPAVPSEYNTGTLLFTWWATLDQWYAAQVAAAVRAWIKANGGG